MTCIVGIEHGGKVYIGGDSAGTNGHWLQTTRTDEKVFRNGPFIMGFTTSFRMGQLLRYSLKVPEQTSQSDYEFMVTTFIDAVRSCLKDGGFSETDKGVEKGGDFLVGYRGRIYSIGNDYQVAHLVDGLGACGCGYEFALGALSVAKGSPHSRIRAALKAAEYWSAGVRGPFKVVSL